MYIWKKAVLGLFVVVFDKCNIKTTLYATLLEEGEIFECTGNFYYFILIIVGYLKWLLDS